MNPLRKYCCFIFRKLYRKSVTCSKRFSAKILSVRLWYYEPKVVPPQHAETETWSEFAISSLKDKEVLLETVSKCGPLHGTYQWTFAGVLVRAADLRKICRSLPAANTMAILTHPLYSLELATCVLSCFKERNRSYKGVVYGRFLKFRNNRQPPYMR